MAYKGRKWGKAGFFAGAILILLSGGQYIWSAEEKNLPPSPIEKKEARGEEQPLRVNAQTLEVDNKKQIITFRGNVVARQGDLTIQADVARVYYEKREEGHEIQKIVATGNVKIYQGNRLAMSQEATLYNPEQKIILTGHPKVWQGKDMLTGEKITVWLKEDKSFVESGPERRVEVIFYLKGEGWEGKGKQ